MKFDKLAGKLVFIEWYYFILLLRWILSEYCFGVRMGFKKIVLKYDDWGFLTQSLLNLKLHSKWKIYSMTSYKGQGRDARYCTFRYPFYMKIGLLVIKSLFIITKMHEFQKIFQNYIKNQKLGNMRWEIFHSMIHVW